jgi:trimeric autotransporter adhesin
VAASVARPAPEPAGDAPAASTGPAVPTPTPSAAADPGAAADDDAAYDLDAANPPLTAADCAPGTVCVDPTRFGARPDDGADDSAAFEAAVRAGTVVLVPPGTYLLGRPLRLRAGQTLAGAGMARTTLLLSWAQLANFPFDYVISPEGATATDVTVRDLTVDGGRRKKACADGAYTGGCVHNRGGGISVGTRWTVTQTRFTGLNYFKLWICDATDVRILDNRWDNRAPGTGSGGEDNIGGGCATNGITLAGNRFDDTLVGNVIDLARASGVRVTGNVSLKGSVFLEGVTDATFTRGVILGGGLNVLSNAGYDSAAQYGNHNPTGVSVTDNRIENAVWGINLRYSDRPGVTNRPGGGNVIARNTVTGAARVAILVTACQPTARTRPDTVTDNVVVDAGTDAAATYNSGCALLEPVGIAVAAGSGDTVTGNTVTDTRTPALTRYGISLGARYAPPTDRTVLRDNRVTGVPGGVEYHAG